MALEHGAGSGGAGRAWSTAVVGQVGRAASVASEYAASVWMRESATTAYERGHEAHAAEVAIAASEDGLSAIVQLVVGEPGVVHGELRSLEDRVHAVAELGGDPALLGSPGHGEAHVDGDGVPVVQRRRVRELVARRPRVPEGDSPVLVVLVQVPLLLVSIVAVVLFMVRLSVAMRIHYRKKSGIWACVQCCLPKWQLVA